MSASSLNPRPETASKYGCSRRAAGIFPQKFRASAREIGTAIVWTGGCMRIPRRGSSLTLAARRRSSIRPGYQWHDRHGAACRCESRCVRVERGDLHARGTWRAAIARLADVKAVGVTTIEMMPVAEFPALGGLRRCLPVCADLLRRHRMTSGLTDHAHSLGLGVILDVVYNHFDHPAVCTRHAQQHFAERYANEWGDALNFDGPDAEPVREYFARNAAH
jgi:hypothetical protein